MKETSIQRDEIRGKKLTAITAFDEGTTIKNDLIKTVISQEGVQIIFIIDRS